MAIRSTALQSALAGMNSAFNQLGAAAQNLANPLFASPKEISSANGTADGEATSPLSATQSMSADVGDSLMALNESLTQARANSATARTAQGMLEELLQIGRH